MQNRTPPVISTVRSEILLASSLPPITASAVQSACPMHAPSVTPIGSRAAACVTRRVERDRERDSKW